MNPEIIKLIDRISVLEKIVKDLTSSNTIPLWLDQALTGRGFLKPGLSGILKGNGTAAISAIVPLSGVKTYYVANTSGGAVTRKLTFTNGILTSET